MRRRWANRAIAGLVALCMLLACCAFATELEVAPTEGAAATESEAAIEPEVALEPEDVVEPEGAVEPETSAEPEDAVEPKEVAEPETTAEPEAAVAPEATAEPEAAVEPEATAEPEAAVEPETAAEPEATAEPEIAVESEATVEPEMMLLAAAASCAHQYEGQSCVCLLCGETVHRDPQVSDSSLAVECNSGDASGHTKTGYNVTDYTCQVCGESWETIGGVAAEVRERHFFDMGTCGACGYACPHDEKDVWHDYEDAVYSEGNESGHKVSGHRRQHYSCKKCGHSWETPVEAEISSEREAHSFYNGACSHCGYQNSCPHENVETWTDWSDTSYSDATAEGHLVTGYRTIYYDCLDCGDEKYIEEDSVSSEREGHDFQGGKCRDCGYANSCSNAHTVVLVDSWNFSNYGDAHDVNAEGHTATADHMIDYYCCDCDDSWTVYEDGISVREAHRFWNGVCWVCGRNNFCAHENVESYDYWQGEYYDDGNDESHFVEGPPLVKYTCPDCGEWYDEPRAGDPSGRVLHEYQNGACVVCLHVCQHSGGGKEISSEIVGAPAYAPVDAQNHSVAVLWKRELECNYCGSSYQETKPGTEEQPHRFDAGVCMDCGYVKPAATPTPVYEEVPAAEAVHGVKAEDAQPIAETMISVAEALEAESEAVAVRIVNIEKILTADELAALDRLPMKEQLLTFLSAIGFEDPVNRTLAARQESLSAEAEALKEQIRARIAAMDDAARAEFEAALLASFPRETIVIDGVEYEFFVLEIEVQAGGATRRERYGFRREGEQWLFTRLEIDE